MYATVTRVPDARAPAHTCIIVYMYIYGRKLSAEKIKRNREKFAASELYRYTCYYIRVRVWEHFFTEKRFAMRPYF